MWKCSFCKNDNKDTLKVCPTCGNKQGAINPSEVNATSDRSVSVLDSSENNCTEFYELRKWGKIAYILSWIIGIGAFLFAGITFETDVSGETKLAYNLVLMFGGIFNLLCFVGAGLAFKLLANSLSIIVESSYRSMRK